MSKHTPEPWIAHGFMIRDESGNLVCEVFNYCGQYSKPNSLLIAASPQLLKAAELLQEACTFGEGDTVEVCDWEKLYEAYREAGLSYAEAVYGTLDPDEIARMKGE